MKNNKKMYKVMFYFEAALLNSHRYKSKSILSIAICAFIVLLLNVYLGNIQSNQLQLKRLPDAIPVSAKVCNLNGSQDAGLNIKEEVITKIQESDYVKDAVFTIQLKMGIGEFAEEDYLEHLNLFAVGTNHYSGISGLKKEDITLRKNTELSFLSSRLKECLMDKRVMEQNDLKVGDTVILTTYYYFYEKYKPILIKPLQVDTYKIGGEINLLNYTGTLVPPSVIVPIETIQDAYHKAGLSFTADSASFYIKDPMKLNEFKEEMQELGMLSVIASAEYAYDGNALAVRDETFRLSAEKIEEGLALLYHMLPFVFLIVGCSGFVTAYLLIQNRRGEYAIMRALGNSSFGCFCIMFFENLLLILSGIALGSIVVHYQMQTDFLILMKTAGGFFVFYMLGIVIALWTAGRLSVMNALAKND